MIPKIEDEVIERLRHAAEAGADISGATFGAVAGFLLGGPVGAGAGAADGAYIGYTLKRAGNEVFKRHLSPREELRLGAVIISAADTMKEKLSSGHQPRDDDFFETEHDGRSSADEITEGVLLVAQREYEEKKIKYLGRMLANIAFDKTVSRDQANLLIRTADQIGYSSFCIMRAVRERLYRHVPINKYFSMIAEIKQPFTSNDLSLITNVASLERLGVLYAGDILSLGGLWARSIKEIRLQGIGLQLYRLMELDRLEPQEWNLAREILDFAENEGERLITM